MTRRLQAIQEDEFNIPKESRISKKLVERTNLIVIVLIFVTLFCLAFLQFDIYASNPTPYEQGAKILD